MKTKVTTAFDVLNGSDPFGDAGCRSGELLDLAADTDIDGHFKVAS